MLFKLYEGYAKQTNRLNEKIGEILKDGRVDQEEMPAYSELTAGSASNTTAWCCTSTTSTT